MYKIAFKQANKKLQTLYTKEKPMYFLQLSALLPSGTKVEVEAEVLYNNIGTTPPTKTKQAVVENVVPSAIEEQTFIETTNDSFYKEWFKIVQED